MVGNHLPKSTNCIYFEFKCVLDEHHVIAVTTKALVANATVSSKSKDYYNYLIFLLL